MCNKHPCPHTRPRKLSLRFANDNVADRVLDRTDYLKVVKQNPALLQLEAQRVTKETSVSVQPLKPQQVLLTKVRASSLKTISTSTAQPSSLIVPLNHRLDVAAKVPDPTLVSKLAKNKVIVHSGFKSLAKAQTQASVSANPIPSKRKNSLPKKVSTSFPLTLPTSCKLSPRKEPSFESKQVDTNPLKLVIKRCHTSSSSSSSGGVPMLPPGPVCMGSSRCVPPHPGTAQHLSSYQRGVGSVFKKPLVQPSMPNLNLNPESSTGLQTSFNSTSTVQPTTSISPTATYPASTFALQSNLPFEIKPEIKDEIKTEIKDEPEDFWPDDGLAANPSQLQLDEILRRDIKREMLSFEEQEKLQDLMNNVAPVAPPCGCIRAGDKEGNYGIYYNQLGFGKDLVQIR